MTHDKLKTIKKIKEMGTYIWGLEVFSERDPSLKTKQGLSA